MSDKERLEGTMQMMQNVARMLLLIPQEDIDAVLREINHTDAVMPLLDPTGWMRIADNIPSHRKVYQALSIARREIALVVESHERKH